MMKKTGVRGFLKAAVVACLATALSGPMAAVAQTDDTAIPINIGLPVSNYWPAYVARDLGLFEKAGLKPNYYSFNTGAPLIAGMKSGSLDVVWTGLATLFMLGQGVPLTYIYTPLDSSSQEGMVVNPATGIESYKDLAKARNIGTATATCGHIATVLAAEKAGVPLSDLQISNLNPELLRPAFDQGQIDVAFVWGPWNLQLQQAGYPIVNWDADYDGAVCATNVAVRPTFLQEHPKVGCRLVKVQALTLAAVKDNPELGISALQKELNLTPEIAKQTFETLAIPSLEEQVEDDSAWSLTSQDGGLAGKLHRAAEALYKVQVFRERLSIDQIRDSIDSRYVKEFLTSGCE